MASITGPGEISIGPHKSKAKERKFAQDLEALGQDLQQKITERVGDRIEIEKRMLEDYRQYHGKYEPKVQAQLNQNQYGSQIFVKLTRAKTDLAEARTVDMIFPNDDRNWDVRPTPNPDLAANLNNEAPVTNPENPDEQIMDAATGQPITEAQVSQELMTRAIKSCNAMRKEMDDQLVEAKYSQVGRQVIHNAALYGTGILKGPQATARMRKAWVPMMIEGKKQYVLEVKEDLRPDVSSVNPWHFFPDLSTSDPCDLEDVFERHLMTKSQVRKLAKEPGFMRTQVAALLETDPTDDGLETYLSELAAISDINTDLTNNRYRIWEYHGPLKKKLLKDAGFSIDEENPLEQVSGVVWFSNGIILKLGINILDSGELNYSVFNWERDESTVFGYGIPYQMRDTQRVANAAWRMILDNAGLTTGPQIVMRREALEPSDGSWELSPRKIWYVTDDSVRVQDVFKTFNIEGHYNELFSIFNQAVTLIDEETSLPRVAQGQQTSSRETYSGLALRTNASNIVQRRIVKNYDDYVTLTFIPRLYDYNMQFNKKDELKGDFEVMARGSDVLVVREIQAQLLLSMLQLANDPTYGPWTKVRELYKRTLAANHVNPEDILKTEDEYQKDLQEMQAQAKAQAEAQQPQPDERAAAMTQKAQMDAEVKGALAQVQLEIAQINQETELSRIAAEREISLEELRAKIGIADKKHEFEAAKFLEELKRKDRFGTGV